MAGRDAKNGGSTSNGSKQAKKGPPRGSAAVGSVVRRHRRDIWGLAAIVAGLIVAGSVWFAAAGPVGEQVDRALAAGFGLVRSALPVGLVVVGVAALWGGHRSGRSGRAPGGDGGGDDTEAGAPPVGGPDSGARMLVGGVLLLVSSTGLLHVGRGRPGLGDGIDELGAAGGALGVGIGGFLHAWTALWGSVLLLGFVGLIGVIVVTRATVRSAAEAALAVVRSTAAAVLAVLRPLWRVLRAAAVNLFSDLKEAPAGRDAAGPPPYGHAEGAPFPVDPGSSDAGMDDDPMPAEPEPSPPAEFAPVPADPAKVLAAGASRKRRDGPSKWRLPAAKVLTVTPSRQIDKAAVAERGQLLQATLDRFDVQTILLEPVVGPTVTRFVLELGEGVKVSKLENLRKDIAYAMASPDVRILAPIPGRRAIGVEVPNLDRHIVRLGDVLRSPEARAAEHPLEVAIGRDINGQSMMMNLATTPHLLIAGATGAGKSSCLNSLITSVLMRSTPDEVRMILVDPKRVEMGQYDRVPHLLTAPVTDPRKAANALSWAVREMERRYDLLHETGFRDITGYNGAVDEDSLDPPRGARDADGEPLRYQRLPFVLLVVDELADLMMVAARDVEESIARIAQMARAVGIHLVIATQRPSVNIITGVIKANIPARLAFAVASLTDSRGHPRPARRRAAGGPGRHAVARALVVDASPHPGLLGDRGRGPRRGGALGGPGARLRRRSVGLHRRAAWRRVRRPAAAGARPGRGADNAGQHHGRASAGGRRRRRTARRGHGPGGRDPTGIHLDAPASPAGGLREGGADHGSARAAGRGRPVHRVQGPRGSHHPRGVRGQAGRLSRCCWVSSTRSSA